MASTTGRMPLGSAMVWLTMVTGSAAQSGSSDISAVPVDTTEGEAPEGSSAGSVGDGSSGVGGASIDTMSQLGSTSQAAQGVCRPACRPGFVCHEGACISACNPACGPGQICTAQRTCEWGPELSPEVKQQRRDTNRSVENLRWRQEHRLAGRTFLIPYLSVMMLGSESVAPGVAMFVGYAKNLTQAVGISVSFGGSVDLALVSSGAQVEDEDGMPTSYDSNEGLAYTAQAQFFPYLGPFGRFYIGPIGWLAYVGTGQEEISVMEPDGTRTGVRVKPGVTGGGGLGAGFLIGAHEDYDLRLVFRTSGTDESVPFSMLMGFGFRL